MDVFKDDALPSIRNRALLVSVSFRKPQMTKFDRKATDDAELANNAKGAIKAQKRLYPKHLVDPIISLEAEVYAYLRRKTVRWGDSSMYLLDTSCFAEVREQLEEYKVQREQLVTVFAQNWAQVLETAQDQQGALFDPSVYPDVGEVASQFTMNLSFMPVGTLGTDLFDNIESELKEVIEQHVTETTNRLVSDAVRDPLRRLMSCVINIHDKTSRTDSRIHESLMKELTELVEDMPSLNITGVKELDDLARYCRATLLKSTEEIKDKESSARADVAKAAGVLLESSDINPETAKKLTVSERAVMAEEAADKMLASIKGIV